jgi:predicted restriction endonuclease
MSNDDKASCWLAKLTRLNPATGRGESRGKAPHKPILLLSLLDMAETGEVTSPAFTRSSGLVLRFRNYGSITAARWQTRLDIRTPFFYLSRQDFWEPLTAEMHRAGSPETCAVRVVSEYRYTCALTGYRCLTSEGATIVDAAHIEPWAKTQNDDPLNGLALSKDAHWMFDEGLWTVGDDLRVVVGNSRFTESGPEAFKLGSFAGRYLQFDPA